MVSSAVPGMEIPFFRYHHSKGKGIIMCMRFNLLHACMHAAKESEIAHNLRICRHLQFQCEGFLLRALWECVV